MRVRIRLRVVMGPIRLLVVRAMIPLMVVQVAIFT